MILKAIAPHRSCTAAALHVCVVLLCAAPALARSASQSIPAPPAAAVSTETDVIHGIQVVDPYRWLENSSSPQAQEWIAAEQAYTTALLSKRPEMEQLRRDVHDLADLEQAQRVLFRRGRYFVLKREPGRAIAALYMREGENGPEKLLLDPETWSPDQSDTLELLNVSNDGKLVVYGIRHGGRDQLRIHFYDVDAGHDLADLLPEARYIYWSMPIAPDRSRIFYIRFDDAGPRVCEHRIGASVSTDRVLFGEELGPDKIVQISLSDDGKLLLIHVLHGASGSTDLYAKQLEPEAPARVVVKDIQATFTGESAGGKIYILTNWNAPHGRVVVADAANPSPEHWRTLIPESEGTIQAFHLAGGRLVINAMVDAHSQLRVFDPDGREHESIPLPGMGSVTTIDGEWNSPALCFSYSSFQVPTRFYSYGLTTRKLATVSKPANLPQLSDIVVDQVWYQSKDGTRVPMYLAHKKDLVKDGNQPVLLYGYGGFNWAQLPEFTPEIGVWLERGGIYAVANIRGGNEFGESWHRAGELDQKQHSFDDFITAAEWPLPSGVIR